MNPTNNEQIMDFEDNKKVPFETKICHSKIAAILDIIGAIFGVIFFTLVTIAAIITSKFDIFIVLVPFVLCSLALYLVYTSFKDYKKISKKAAQIILNEKGLQTINSKFFTWDGITKEQVINEGKGNEIRYYLMYEYGNATEKVLLNTDEIDTSPMKLTKLLKIYRGRFEMNRLKNSEKQD